MGNITEKAKKKKARQDKLRKVSMLAFGVMVGFLQTASSYYLREIYNIKTLFLSWGLAKSDVMVTAGDIALLERQVATKLLVDNSLLVAEQVREICIVLLVVTAAYIIGKNLKERISLFALFAGSAGLVYYASLFALLRWPDSLTSKDVITLVPIPIIGPVYIPVLLSGLALIAGLFMVYKKA